MLWLCVSVANRKQLPGTISISIETRGQSTSGTLVVITLPVDGSVGGYCLLRNQLSQLAITQSTSQQNFGRKHEMMSSHE